MLSSLRFFENNLQPKASLESIYASKRSSWFRFKKLSGNYSKFNFNDIAELSFLEGLLHKCKSNYFFYGFQPSLNAIITRSYHIQLKHIHEIFMRFMSEKREKLTFLRIAKKMQNKIFTYIETPWITFAPFSAFKNESVEKCLKKFIIFKYGNVKWNLLPSNKHP